MSDTLRIVTSDSADLFPEVRARPLCLAQVKHSTQLSADVRATEEGQGQLEAFDELVRN